MKKRIFVCVSALLLCITASFAWLSNIENNYVKNIDIDYTKDGALSVANRNITANLYAPDSDGVYNPVDEGFNFDSRDVIPGAVIPFEIRMTNSARSATMVKISLAINVSDERLLDVLFVEIWPGAGFSGANNSRIYRKLSEASRVGNEGSGEYVITLYGDTNKLLVPIDGEVTLDCNFYFDKEATAEHQHMALKKLSFRVE